MTWGEFKKKIESQGVEDDDKINYIDWAFDCEEPVVEFDHVGNFSVH